MAGKSTYLRQNALIAALAQMGSYVPAKRRAIGVVDRLFSPRRRGRRSRARALDLHGRDGRDGGDPQPGDDAQPRHPRRDRARHGDLRRPVDRPGLRRAAQRRQPLPHSVRHAFPRADAARRDDAAPVQPDDAGARASRATGVPARGRARRRRIAPTACRSRSSPACRRRWSSARGRCWPNSKGKGAGDARCRCSAMSPPEPEPAHDALREMLAALDPDALSPREAQAMLYELKRMADGADGREDPAGERPCRLSLRDLAGAGVPGAVHAGGLEGAGAGREVHRRPSRRRRHLGRAGGGGDRRRQPARRDAVSGARLRLRLLSRSISAGGR